MQHRLRDQLEMRSGRYVLGGRRLARRGEHLEVQGRHV